MGPPGKNGPTTALFNNEVKLNTTDWLTVCRLPFDGESHNLRDILVNASSLSRIEYKIHDLQDDTILEDSSPIHRKYLHTVKLTPTSPSELTTIELRARARKEKLLEADDDEKEQPSMVHAVEINIL